MNRYEKKLKQLLEENNFKLVRTGNHIVYRNPDGITFVQPKTPSDFRSIKNAISDLKRRVRQPEPEPIIEQAIEQTIEQATAKDVPVRNIGMSPERWARQFPQIPVTPNKPSERRERIKLIDSYACNSALSTEIKHAFNQFKLSEDDVRLDEDDLRRLREANVEHAAQEVLARKQKFFREKFAGVNRRIDIAAHEAIKLASIICKSVRKSMVAKITDDTIHIRKFKPDAERRITAGFAQMLWNDFSPMFHDAPRLAPELTKAAARHWDLIIMLALGYKIQRAAGGLYIESYDPKAKPDEEKE